MKRIRSSLAIIALLATLSGSFFFQVSGSIASAASHHAGSSVAAAQTSKAVAVKRLGPCPILGLDC